MANVKSTELSERELDILKLVATGASNKEIAQTLYISQNTVKVHLRNIFSKISAASRTEAAMYAVRIGLVETVNNLIEDNRSSQAIPEISSQTTISSTAKGNARWSTRYLGIIGGLLLIIVTLGLVFNIGGIFPVNSNIPPTPTQRVQWFQLPGLPTPRWGLAVTNYESQIYAIGGETLQGISNVVEKYDPQTNTWSNLSDKSTAVTDINSVAFGGLIYVPGGKLTTGMPTDRNEIYDPNSDQWSLGKSLPKPLSAYALTVYEGRMYLFGGWDGKRVINNAYVFDFRENTWSEIPSMPTARSYAGAVVVGGKIYVIGGYDGNQALAVNEVYLPDFSGDGSPWVQAPALPSGRYGMGITNLADIIFILGGIGATDNLSTIALSSGDQNWGQLQSPLHSDWSFLNAVTVGTRLYVLGGKTDAGLSTDMWSYQAIFTITFPIIR
ncbi:MAG: kelch repeat-containing protein [Anaerolineales bacterium]